MVHNMSNNLCCFSIEVESFLVTLGSVLETNKTRHSHETFNAVTDVTDIVANFCGASAQILHSKSVRSTDLYQVDFS